MMNCGVDVEWLPLSIMYEDFNLVETNVCLHNLGVTSNRLYCLFPGLSSRPFQGFDDIQEIRCSGETLPQDTDVIVVLLYEVSGGSSSLLGTMNVNKGDCTTSDDYASCYVSDGDSRQSSLSVLISDLAEGQSRVYGCNVTALLSRIHTRVYSWSVTVRHIPRELLSLCWSVIL